MEDITDNKMSEKLYTALYRISETAGSSISLNELYHAVHEIISELIPAKNFYFALYDEKSNILHFPYRADEYEEYPIARPLRPGMIDEVIRTGKPLLAHPGILAKMRANNMALPTRKKVATYLLGVPLKASDGGVMGVMAVKAYDEGIIYTEKHRDILSFVSDQVTRTIERKRAAEELQKYKEHLEELVKERTDDLDKTNASLKAEIAERKMAEKLQMTLYRISETVWSSCNLEELYRSVHEIIVELIPAKNFYITLYDEQENLLHFPYCVDEYDNYPISRPLRNGLVEYVINTGHPVLVDQLRLMEMMAKGEIEMDDSKLSNDWLGVPLKTVDNRVFGAMVLKNSPNDMRYSEQHFEILNFVSNQIALAIERKRTEGRLRFLSMHDVLTGLYNRAYFEEELNRLKDGRYMPCSLIICDVDKLKVVNDTLGHAVGDQLLIAAARIIKSSARDCDVVARIGGDEFAIVLPWADEQAAYQVTGRIRQQIVEYNQNATEFFVNISIGYAVQNDNAISVQGLYKEADNNMYQEKMQHSQSTRSSRRN